jgi:hypothetical protein
LYCEQHEPQFPGFSFHVLYDQRSIAFFVIFLTGIDIGDPLLDHGIDQTDQLMSGDSDSLGRPQSRPLPMKISSPCALRSEKREGLI